MSDFPSAEQQARDLLDRATTMITTIEYAQFHGISQAYPDSIIRDITASLIAEVSRIRAQETRIRELANQHVGAPCDCNAIAHQILAALDTEGEDQ